MEALLAGDPAPAEGDQDDPAGCRQQGSLPRFRSPARGCVEVQPGLEENRKAAIADVVGVVQLRSQQQVEDNDQPLHRSQTAAQEVTGAKLSAASLVTAELVASPGAERDPG